MKDMGKSATKELVSEGRRMVDSEVLVQILEKDKKFRFATRTPATDKIV